MNIKDVTKLDKKQIEGIYSKCIEFANEIKNPDLKECCVKIFTDYKKKMISKPATGDPCHHFYAGGLIYHTYCVTRNAITIAKMYDYINFDLDLIIFGALLHDIGKTNDYKDFDKIAEKNDNGILSSGSFMLGHSYEGCYIVQNYLEKYKLNDSFKHQALHMIGSHMRTFSEFGVLTLPKMFEVIVINYADSMDANLDKIRRGINNGEKGELYFNENDSDEFYKSCNPYYIK